MERACAWPRAARRSLQNSYVAKYSIAVGMVPSTAPDRPRYTSRGPCRRRRRPLRRYNQTESACLQRWPGTRLPRPSGTPSGASRRYYAQSGPAATPHSKMPRSTPSSTYLADTAVRQAVQLAHPWATSAGGSESKQCCPMPQQQAALAAVQEPSALCQGRAQQGAGARLEQHVAAVHDAARAQVHVQRLRLGAAAPGAQLLRRARLVHLRARHECARARTRVAQAAGCAEPGR